MNIRKCFFIAFALAEWGLTICTAVSGSPNVPVPVYTTAKPPTDCPNLPVTPTPTKAPLELKPAVTPAPTQTPPTECPNSPVPPTPTKAPRELEPAVTPAPTQTPPTECPNLPVPPTPTKAPLELEPAVTPAPTQKLPTDCPNLPVPPSPTKAPLETEIAPVTPGPTQKPTTTGCPDLPFPTNPTKPPLQPETVLPAIPTEKPASGNEGSMCHPAAPSNTTCNFPLPCFNYWPCSAFAGNVNKNFTCLNPCPLGPLNSLSVCGQKAAFAASTSAITNCRGCNLIVTCCNQQPCSHNLGPPTATTTTTATPEPLTTPAPAPAPLIKCPSGTVLLGKRCHLLYCPRGSQMINERCVVIECPAGTIWTENRCSVPQPIVYNVTYQTNILTQFNQTKPDVILNNTNNIYVNATVALSDDKEYNKDCSSDDEDCAEEIFSSETSTTPMTPAVKCCDVRTPRICEPHNNHWRCYSRRSRRCGDFCIAPVIYLKPSRIHATQRYLVMPPIPNDCTSYDNCGPQMGRYDCSGCAFNNMERCSYYCYRYVCPAGKCNFYDQQKYCVHNFGLYGCQEEDGCLDRWCL